MNAKTILLCAVWFCACVGSNRAAVVADPDAGLDPSDNTSAPDADAADVPFVCVGGDCTPPCESDGECDDGLDCTGDLCDKGRCTHAPTHAVSRQIARLLWEPLFRSIETCGMPGAT